MAALIVGQTVFHSVDWHKDTHARKNCRLKGGRKMMGFFLFRLLPIRFYFSTNDQTSTQFSV